MVKDVELLINTGLDEIENSSLVILMLRVYSKLYNQPDAVHILGNSCKNCKRKIKKIYEQLKINGMKLAQNLDKPRTCKPAWTGLRYISGAAKHFHADTFTDENAISLLDKGILSKNDFIKLPDGYGVEQPKQIVENAPIKKVSKKKK